MQMIQARLKSAVIVYVQVSKVTIGGIRANDNGPSGYATARFSTKKRPAGT